MKNKYYDIKNKIRLFNILIIVEALIFLVVLYFVPTDVNVKGVGQNIIIALKGFVGLTAFYGWALHQREKFLSM